ncbi:MAG: hypothetical protein ACLS59_06830 [Clostridia bacterium]|jgi:hypothetical protein
MNKETILENAQEFIDEYDNIKDTLEDLFDNIKNKDLKEEINGLLSEFEEDFKLEYEEQLQIAKDIEEEEQKALDEEYERSRL